LNNSSPEKNKKKGGFKSMFGIKKKGKTIKGKSEDNIATLQDELDSSRGSLPAREENLTLPPIDSSPVFAEEEESVLSTGAVIEEPQDFMRVISSADAEPEQPTHTSPKRPVPPNRKPPASNEADVEPAQPTHTSPKRPVPLNRKPPAASESDSRPAPPPRKKETLASEGDISENSTPPIPMPRVKPPLPRRSVLSTSDEKIYDTEETPDVNVRPRPPVAASREGLDDPTPESADATASEVEVVSEPAVPPKRRIPGLVAIPGMPALPAGGLAPKLRPKPVPSTFSTGSNDQLQEGDVGRTSPGPKPPVPVKPKGVAASGGELEESVEAEHHVPIQRTSPPMVRIYLC
jgi:hypothetical protein